MSARRRLAGEAAAVRPRRRHRRRLSLALVGLACACLLTSCVLPSMDQSTQNAADQTLGSALKAGSVPSKYVNAVQQAGSCEGVSPPMIAAQVDIAAGGWKNIGSLGSKLPDAVFDPGVDGSGDKKVDRSNPLDAIASLGAYECLLWKGISQAPWFSPGADGMDPQLLTLAAFKEGPSQLGLEFGHYGEDTAKYVSQVTALMGSTYLDDDPNAAGGVSCSSGSAGNTSDGSPTIQGPSTLTVDQIVAWYQKSGHQTPVGHVPTVSSLSTFVGYWVNNPEGIRGDVMFAQSVEETGGFTNSDSQMFNFAGIAHYDNAPAGKAFPSAEDGVIAQSQELRMATGQKPQTSPQYAPNWGGKIVQTWSGLSGNWASDTHYWSTISGIYVDMLKSAGKSPSDIKACNGGSS